MEKVSVVKCPDYKQTLVDNAVTKALTLIDFKPKKGSKVLIKPNCLGFYQKNQIAIVTNPTVIEAICKFLKKYDCEIYIGESSFMNTSDFLKQAGIQKVAEKYGKLLVFDTEELIKISDKKAEFLKEFRIPKIAKEVDYIINVPKLKVHSLTLFTGAIKNNYGYIPGGQKQIYHNKAQGFINFSKLLVDIFQNIKPEINIMDGIIGMEKEGPSSGDPKKAGLILASKNAIALDIAATKIIGIDPKKIYMIKEAINRKLYSSYDFKLVGVKKLPLIKFKQIAHAERKEWLKRNFPQRKVLCNTSRCIQCGICAEKCPVGAIKLDPYPVIDYKKCIRCFCCAEICPMHAMMIKK